MEVKRLSKGPECKMGINDPGTRWQLHLTIERTSDGFNRTAFKLEFVKQAARISSRLWKVRDWTLGRGWPTLEWEKRKWTLWRGSPPPKQKKTILSALA